MSNTNALLWSTFVGMTMFVGALFSLRKIERFNRTNLTGFISGVMLYTAFIEIIPHSKEYLAGRELTQVIFMFAGVLIAILIDKYAPHFHEEDIDCHSYRLGLISFIAISIHNLIEGASLYTITASSSVSGIAYGIGVIAHNLPIGFMLTANLMMSNKDKRKNLLIAFAASLTTVIGAGFGFALNNLGEHIVGILLSISAGMMVHSAVDVLIDSSDGEDTHQVLYHVMAGMLFIGLVLALSGHSH